MHLHRIAILFLLLIALVFTGCAKEAPPEGEPAETPATEAPSEPEPAETEAAKTPTPAEPEPMVVEPEPVVVEPEPALPVGPAVLSTSEIFTLPVADGGEEKLTVEEIQAFLDDPSNHEPFLPAVPLGLSDIAERIPADNPMTRAKVELGRQLYFDPRLSLDGTISCATCHDPARGWAQDTQFAAGIGGQLGGRNSPTVMNRVYGETQFWDGRAASLEDQALGPIQAGVEMGFESGMGPLVERLQEIEGYQIQFEKIFGEVSPDGIAKAIASFERTVLVGGSPYDYAEELKRFEGVEQADLDEDAELAALYETTKQGAESHPMSESAKRGQQLFFDKRVGCALCHVGANLTSEEFFNIGVGMLAEEPDQGRVAVTSDEKDAGAFKTPTLRNIAQSGPYMHDGSQSTLKEVVDFYAKGGHPNDHLHERIKKVDLTDQEKADLVAFMKDGLTGDLPDIPSPRLP